MGGQGDRDRRDQRGKQNRNLCSAAALKPENFIRQQEKVAWSIVCQCKLQLLVLLFPKKGDVLPPTDSWAKNI